MRITCVTFKNKINEHMKKLLFLTFSTIIFSTIISMAQQKELRHVVLFKFKESSSVADIKKVEEAFMALPSKIKQIVSLEWGINNSPENLAQGFTHCFFLSFKSEADRAIYLPHPDHKAFGTILGPHLDKVLVLDYWASK
jgi:uncharacterized membrane protein YqgA involved in biofilm formation